MEKLARRSTSMRLTGVGYAYLGILGLALLAGVNDTHSIALLLASTFLGLFVVTVVRGALFLPMTRLVRLEIEPVFAGDPIPVRVSLESRIPRPDASLELEAKTTCRLGIDAMRLEGARSDLAVSLPPRRRGRLTLESLQMTSVYPMGLLRWSVRFDRLESSAATTWIYPMPIDYLARPEHSLGRPQSTAMGDFDELQTWQSGDSISGLCWKTYARTGKRMRKRFQESTAEPSSASLLAESEDPWLNGDLLDSLGDEEQRSQLCFWVVERQNRREPYSLRFRGRHITTAAGPQHDQRCLALLSAD